MKLLTQNSELKANGIWNFSLPAHAVKLSSGAWFNCCPSAGVCAGMCYAKNGSYLFPSVAAKHLANLEYTLNDLTGWMLDMIDEIGSKKKINHIRIHDAGDFYSEDYLMAWVQIAKHFPRILFYAYTKEVSLFKRVFQSECPRNFKYLFSLGGKEDHLIDVETDRHAEVFASEEDLEDAGYSNQSANDLLCVTLPSNKIGIVANNISRYKKKLGASTFGKLQENRSDKIKETLHK